MPTFTILAPNGKKYKVSGPNREGAIRALNDKLNPQPKNDSNNSGNNTGINSPTGGFKEAFLQGIDAPLDAMGTTANVLGYEKTGEFLTNLTEAPEGYESSSAKFIKGDEDGSYAYRYLPKAAVEQGAQFAGQMMARASGAAVGSTLGPGGAIVGGIAAPVIFSAVQHLGPLAEERARNQGRDKPNKDDFLYVSTSTAGIALLDSLGLGGGKIFTSALKEFGTESLQSVIEQTGATVNTKAGFDVDPRQAIGEGIIGGTSAGVVKTGLSSVNAVRPKPFDDTEQNRSATAFANRLKKVAEANNLNLKDVDVKSTNGAREAVTKAHTQIEKDLKQVFKDLKPLVAVTDQDTLVDLEDKILSEAALAEGKTLAKSQVGEQELNALARLAGQTYEGQKARNLLLEMNELTALHKSGYKGGVSKVTDLANPLNNLTHPFSSQGGITGLATTGAAYMAGGGTGLAIQGGAFAGGRAIDAMTGRRSTVNKYIRDNTKANRETQLSPTGPSLREQAIAEAQQAESAIEDQKMQELELNRSQYNRGAPPKGDPNDPNPAPQFVMENSTGLSTAGVADALEKIEADNPLPILQRSIDSYRISVRDGGAVSNLTQLIREVKLKIISDPSVQAQVINKPQPIPGETTQPQQSPQSPEPQQQSDVMQRLRAATVDYNPNAKLDAEPQFGPKFTTQENYNRGIEANKKFNADQKVALNKINNEGIMSESDYKTLSQAIDELDGNLGSKPLETFEAVYKKLEGVDPQFVQEIIDPMYERITKQQRQRTVKTREGKTKEQRAVAVPAQFGSTTDVALDTNLNNSFTMARDKVYNKGRDFKLDLQAKSLEAQEREGIDLSTLDDANIDRLADFAYTDALEALKDNQNAIGWYGRTVDQALKTVAEIHPEVLTDPKAKMQFIWATAVTSNGLKVDKNFELALDVYETLKETGRFPTDAGIGQAAKGINFGLGQYHTMLDKFNRLSNSDDGAHALLSDFMDSKFPLKQLEKEYDVKISGEGKDTLIRGAAILGPKIGGGFYSNLYGKFDELTMDRWLMRTVGRWRGGLVNINKPMIKKKTTEIKGMMKSYDLKPFKSLFYKAAIKPTKNMSNNKIEQLSQIIAKRSMDPEWRKQINVIPGGPELRKAGNGLDKYLDGQVEAPAGPKERNFIRAVFAQTLDRLNASPELKAISNEPITMSDLQALMWYPEKRLYDTAKQKDGESRGYKDDEAPDYANAARKAVANRLELSGQNGNGLRSPGRTGSPGGGTAPTNAGLPGATRQGILGQFFGGGQRNAAPKNNDRSQPVSEAEIRV